VAHRWPAAPRRTANRAVAALIGALGAAAFLLSACGGGGSGPPGVANLGSSTTTTAPAAAQGGNKATNYADAVSYAACMRTHGVPNMPDPTSNGDFLDVKGVLNGVAGVDPNSSAFQKADKACSHFLPNGGQMTPAEQQQAIAKALKFVQCMRTHGVPNMPDPKTSNGGIAIGGPGLDPSSPTFQAAQKACRSVSPFPSP
jgi:hypothetical protein